MQTINFYNKNEGINVCEEYFQTGVPLYIDVNDKPMMRLINNNINKLLEHITEKKEIREIVENNIEGFIIITKILNKYEISGIILFGPQMITGSRIIKLLYGFNSRVRETLIITLMNYFSNIENLAVYTKAYNNEDLITYIKLGYKYPRVNLDDNGNFMYCRLKYES